VQRQSAVVVLALRRLRSRPYEGFGDAVGRSVGAGMVQWHAAVVVLRQCRLDVSSEDLADDLLGCALETRVVQKEDVRRPCRSRTGSSDVSLDGLLPHLTQRCFYQRLGKRGSGSFDRYRIPR